MKKIITLLGCLICLFCCAFNVQAQIEETIKGRWDLMVEKDGQHFVALSTCKRKLKKPSKVAGT
ncbi:MAG: hypothetical protein AAF960_09300 [Bacteroidota bacterium]